MLLPGFRRQGLNRQLTERAVEAAAADHDFCFLFADEDARPFYERCGFLPVPEARPHVPTEGREAIPGLVQLDPSDPRDWQRIVDLAHRRAPVSRRLGVLNPKLLLFHALYTLADRLHHVAPLDVLVAMEHVGHRLVLFDVIAEQMPTLEQLVPYLVRPETREIVFQFVPDQLEPPEFEWRQIPPGESGLHDRGDHPLRGEEFLFPFTAHA